MNVVIESDYDFSKIWKFEGSGPLDQLIPIVCFAYSRVLHAGIRLPVYENGQQIVLYMMANFSNSRVTTQSQMKTRYFKIVGTGQKLPLDDDIRHWIHIKTFIDHTFMWHLMEAVKNERE